MTASRGNRWIALLAASLAASAGGCSSGDGANQRIGLGSTTRQTAWPEPESADHTALARQVVSADQTPPTTGHRSVTNREGDAVPLRGQEEAVTVNDVLAMNEAGMPEEQIREQIRVRGIAQRATAHDAYLLQNAGVPSAIIDTMRATKSATRNRPPEERASMTIAPVDPYPSAKKTSPLSVGFM